jgi:hypothetical protein
VTQCAAVTGHLTGYDVKCSAQLTGSVSIADGVRRVGCRTGGTTNRPRRRVLQGEKNRRYFILEACKRASLSSLNAGRPNSGIAVFIRPTVDDVKKSLGSECLLSRSANSQAAQPSYVIPGVKAPLRCACRLVPYSFHESLPFTSSNPPESAFGFHIQNPPTFRSKFFQSRGAVVSRRSSRSMGPSPE